MGKRKRFTTNIEEKIIIKLKIASIKLGKTPNDIVEEALKDYFKKNKVES